MLMLSLFLASQAPLPEMIPLDHKTLLGRTAPSFELQKEGGGTLKLESLRGKTVVIAFWASWCGPCQKELPELQSLARRYPNVAFLAVNVDRNSSSGRRMMERLKFQLPVVYDPKNEALALYDVASMPTSYIVDRRGTVKFRKAGYSDRDKLTQLENALRVIAK